MESFDADPGLGCYTLITAALAVVIVILAIASAVLVSGSLK